MQNKAPYVRFFFEGNLFIFGMIVRQGVNKQAKPGVIVRVFCAPMLFRQVPKLNQLHKRKKKELRI